MIYQEFRIYAEFFIQKLFRGMGDLTHCKYTESCKSSFGSISYSPEITKGTMVPKLLYIAFFVQYSDIIRRVLGSNIEGYFTEIKIRAYPCSGSYPNFFCNLVHKKYGHLFWCHFISRQVPGDINESFVYRVDVDVVRRKISKVYPVNSSCIIYILLHSGSSSYILDIWRYFKDSASVFYAPLL